MTASLKFLTVDDVLVLHAIAIEDQGGDPAVRDRSLLDSAVAIPQQQFGGEYLHKDIPAMAAAYAYHICANHPFFDGNKRAATAALIAFLSDNGWSFDATADVAEPIILQLAAGSIDKPAFTHWARTQMHEKPKMELRDFFSQIDPVAFTDRFKSLLPAETQTSPREFTRRAEEAIISIPLLADLGRQQAEAARTGDSNGWDRVTALAVGILTLYVLAEDMGYEW